MMTGDGANDCVSYLLNLLISLLLLKHKLEFHLVNLMLLILHHLAQNQLH